MNQEYMKTRKILPLVLSMSLPMVISMAVNALYNIVDSYFVAKISEDAMTALALVFPMQNLVNAIVIGFAIGINARVAFYLGAKEEKLADESASVGLLLNLIHGLVLALLCSAIMPSFLRMFTGDTQVIALACTYSTRVFAFAPVIGLELAYEKIFQAVGRMKVSMICMMLGCVTNIILDPVFIFAFDMGVQGAALATVISQFTSAILCLIHLMRTKEEYQLHISKIRFDGRVLGEIIRNGVPSGFQNSVISIANVFVQTNINAFGKMAMAGCGSYAKIEGFAFLPVTCFTMALTTFVSQNLGAKQYDRAKKGARFGILCSIIIAELIGAVIYTAAPTLIAAFNSDPEVVHYGVMQARTIALFYFLLAFSHCIADVLRGSGNASIPMLVMLCVWCLFRVSYITVTVRLIPDIRVIFWAYPLTWSISSAIFLYLFLRGKWVYGFEKGGKR